MAWAFGTRDGLIGVAFKLKTYLLGLVERLVQMLRQLKTFLETPFGAFLEDGLSFQGAEFFGNGCGNQRIKADAFML